MIMLRTTFKSAARRGARYLKSQKSKTTREFFPWRPQFPCVPGLQNPFLIWQSHHTRNAQPGDTQGRPRKSISKSSCFVPAMQRAKTGFWRPGTIGLQGISYCKYMISNEIPKIGIWILKTWHPR